MAPRSPDDLRALWHVEGDDVCTPDELLARLEQHPVRPRRRPTMTPLVAASIVLVVVVAAAVVAVRSAHRPVQQGLRSQTVTNSGRPTNPPVGTRRLDLGGAHVRVPIRWFDTPFRGAPATVYFPILFLSTREFTGPCASKTVGVSCDSTDWFPPTWTTPTDGVLVLWSQSEFPFGESLSVLRGRRVTIDHRPAKLYLGAATDSCPPGTTTEIDARVQISDNPGARYDVVACLGARASAADRRAVRTMITSLNIDPHA